MTWRGWALSSRAIGDLWKPCTHGWAAAGAPLLGCSLGEAKHPCLGQTPQEVRSNPPFLTDPAWTPFLGSCKVPVRGGRESTWKEEMALGHAWPLAYPMQGCLS